MRDFNRAMFALIAARRRRPDANRTPDLLDRLMSAHDEDSGAAMSAREIRDQVLTIFVAGHETTALALMWTWYLLAMHPEHEARMHEEIDRVLGGREPCLARRPTPPVHPHDSPGVHAPLSRGTHAGLPPGAAG